MTTYYIKQGRRYVPALHGERWDYSESLMRPGTFQLVYCYRDGSRRYKHDVTPDTAGWQAAAMLASHAMAEAMQKRASAQRHSDIRPYTQRQIDIIERFRREMAEAGGILPEWWMHSTPDEIAEAGIEAVRSYRP